MKTIQFALFFLFILNRLIAQSYTFEGTTMPLGFTTDVNGSTTLSTEHFKEGTQSLCWQTTGSSTLTVSFTGFTASGSNSTYMQIYCPAITNDTLVVDYLNGTTVKKTGRYLCNYKGWREFYRAYNEYSVSASTTINAARLTIKPTDNATRTIYFDNVNFNKTVASRVIGSMWSLDKAWFTGSNANTELLERFANAKDIPVTTPTAAELSALTSFRTNLKRTPTAASSATLSAAKTYVQSLGITRNSDGSIKGNILNTTSGGLTFTFMNDMVTKAEALAADALTNSATMPVFRDFVDYLIDQGVGEGLDFELFSNSYDNCRNITNGFLDILPACTEPQKAEILKLVQWIGFYGDLYHPYPKYVAELNSDVVYLLLPQMLSIAIYQTDDAVAVRELKAFKRFIERNTEYFSGGSSILKVDGTGFHHGTNYNNYMYAYKTWSDYIYNLRGTPFKISAEAYLRFRKAILTVYNMGTLSTGDTHYFSNALCGRKPFSIQVQFSQSQFEKLIIAGGDCLGKAQDDELAAAYNYYFKSTKYSVPAKSYEGFYQYNYSPCAVYRKGNWVATMRAPTTEFFGTEIYTGANRFGRYQSHGSLDIMYEGSLAKSGYPTNNTGGGWDWNVIAGTTTVHYTNWQEMMPNKNKTDRFDQYTKTKDFSGALTMGNCGIFATDFDQTDTWGGQRFTPTNLTFKKSMFAFDNMIISIGNGISASGTYGADMITATNLFQNIVSAESSDLLLNGEKLAKPYHSTLSTTSDNWLITPQGTGYFIPKGNDPIVVKYDNQTTPKHDGSDFDAPITTLPAAKAYINHGVKTSNKSYVFVAFPGTTPEAMATYAALALANPESMYKIEAQTNTVHAITYKPTNTTAYAFFGSTGNLDFGIVKANTGENLLLDKKDDIKNTHSFAICNPNLRPQSSATDSWTATASQSTITLAGEWKLIENVIGVQIAPPTNGETKLTIDLYNGEPVYFSIAEYSTAVKNTTETPWITVNTLPEIFQLKELGLIEGNTVVKLLNVSGKTLLAKQFANKAGTIDIPRKNLPKGIIFCTITGSNRTKTFKLIN